MGNWLGSSPYLPVDTAVYEPFINQRGASGSPAGVASQLTPGLLFLMLLEKVPFKSRVMWLSFLHATSFLQGKISFYYISSLKVMKNNIFLK